MSPSFYRKIYYGSVLIGFVLLLLFPAEIFGFLFDILHSLTDVLIEIFHHFFELLLELGHLVFETIEMMLDHLVEHFFHTSLQATQTIVFYIMLVPGLYIGYRLLRGLISWCRRCVSGLTQAYTDYKSRTVSYWHSVDTLAKLKWLAILGVVLYLISLVSF
jgi:hypothetical protein